MLKRHAAFVAGIDNSDIHPDLLGVNGLGRDHTARETLAAKGHGFEPHSTKRKPQESAFPSQAEVERGPGGDSGPRRFIEIVDGRRGGDAHNSNGWM